MNRYIPIISARPFVWKPETLLMISLSCMLILGCKRESDDPNDVIVSEYDHASDITVVRTPLLQTEQDERLFTFQVEYLHSGTEPAKPPEEYCLRITVTPTGRGIDESWTRIQIEADGKPILSDGRTCETFSGDGKRTFQLYMTETEFRNLARAMTAKAMVNEMTITFPELAQLLLPDLLAKGRGLY